MRVGTRNMAAGEADVTKAQTPRGVASNGRMMFSDHEARSLMNALAANACSRQRATIVWLID